MNDELKNKVDKNRVLHKRGFYTNSASAEMASIIYRKMCFYYDENQGITEMWVSGRLLPFGC